MAWKLPTAVITLEPPCALDWSLGAWGAHPSPAGLMADGLDGDVGFSLTDASSLCCKASLHSCSGTGTPGPRSGGGRQTQGWLWGGDHSSGSPSHSSIGLGQAHFLALPGNPNPEGPLRGFPSRKMHPLEGLVAQDTEMMRAPLFRGTKQSETFPLKERMVLVNPSWRHQGPPVYGVCRVGN